MVRNWWGSFPRELSLYVWSFKHIEEDYVDSWKVKLSLCLTNYNDMKTYGGVEVYSMQS
jgi:hypothetical protein